LCELWNSEENLQASTTNFPHLMPEYLAKISVDLFLPDVVKKINRLSPKIKRLVVIAGEELSNVPFSALPINISQRNSFLIEHFAISYLFCASAYQVLNKRTKLAQGDTALIIQPPSENLNLEIPKYFGQKTFLLQGLEANLNKLSQILNNRSFPIIRFDCHGKFTPTNPTESCLYLSPTATNDGCLTRNHLHPDIEQKPKIKFHNCGTVILGACDTAMFERIRREEQLGLIRSSLAAGAAAVIAARWKAEDITTRVVLNQLQSYLRYNPRDIALQKAILDVLYERIPEIHEPHPISRKTIMNSNHPSRWACFVLHGDAGLQTNANRLTRLFRKWMANKHHHFQ